MIRHAANHHLRSEAVRAYKSALWHGIITPATSCEACSAKGRMHGHHEDYAKPLEVEWLRSPCHRRRHAFRPPGSMTTLEFQVPSAEWKREFKGFCAEHGRTMREVAA